MGTNDLAIQICQHSDEAPNYNLNGKGIKAAKITKAVIVRNGTQAGNDTIDLQFTDESGQIYVAMITAKLLKTVTDICNVKS